MSKVIRTGRFAAPGVARAFWLVSAASLAIVGATGAAAQTQPANPPQTGATAASEGAGSAVVIVTAQRRSERLQNVPAAITAKSATQLTAAGITNTKQLSQVVPGLNFTQAVYLPEPTIRGVGYHGFGNPGDEGVVPIYIDGVYQPFVTAGDMNFNNIDHIEVLKGPQGALYGRDAMGGAINIITKSPMAGFSGDASLSYGRFDEVIGKLYATGGTDRIAADVALVYDRDDGYIKDVLNGKEVGVRNDFSGRFQLRVDPTSNSEFTLAYTHTSNLDSTASANQPVNGNTSAVELDPNVFIARKPYTVALDLEPTNDVRQDAVSLTGVIHASGFDFHTITGWQNDRLNATADSDGTPAPELDIYVAEGSQNIYEEDYLISTKPGPFNWILGGVYYHDDSGSGPQFGPASVFLGVCATEASGHDLLTTPQDSACTSSFDITILGSSRMITNSYAGYFQGTYNITDNLSATFAGRYTSESRDFTAVSLLPVFIPTVQESKTFENFSPSGNITWKVSPQLNLYFRAGDAFKSGLFTQPTPITVAPVNPETLTQYEVGAKASPTSWFSINAAAYYTTWKGLQVIARSQTVGYLQNAANAQVYGVEVDWDLRPIDRLDVNGGLAYTHGTYSSFKNASVNIPFTGAECVAMFGVPAPCGNANPTLDVSGNQLINTPDFTFNLGANYTIPLSFGSLLLNGNYYYSDGFFWDPANQFKEPAYGLLNAQVTWTAPDNRYAVTLWGENITNTRYDLTEVYSQNLTRVYAKPVTYGLRLDYHW